MAKYQLTVNPIRTLFDMTPGFKPFTVISTMLTD